MRGVYKALEQFGFQKGKILEPAMGIGNFFHGLPESMRKSRLYGVEIDAISGRIAQKLHPSASIQIKGFEKTEFEDNSFDVIVGNVPFGDFRLYDPRYKKMKLKVHDYFIRKSLDLLRPGGILAVVTSKGTLDKNDSTVTVSYTHLVTQRALSLKTVVLFLCIKRRYCYVEKGEMGENATGRLTTYYVAECMEFNRYGEYREDIHSAEEAVKIYQSIPSERLNAGKGIGLHVEEEDGIPLEFSLVYNGELDVDLLRDIYDQNQYPEVFIAAKMCIRDRSFHCTVAGIL